jgi:hypothetical protein
VTVGELVTRMTAAEFLAWRAVDIYDPIGNLRLVRQSALIAAVLANIHRDPKHEAYDLDDFDLYRERKILTRAEEEARFRAAFQARGLVRRAA